MSAEELAGEGEPHDQEGPQAALAEANQDQERPDPLGRRSLADPGRDPGHVQPRSEQGEGEDRHRHDRDVQEEDVVELGAEHVVGVVVDRVAEHRDPRDFGPPRASSRQDQRAEQERRRQHERRQIPTLERLASPRTIRVEPADEEPSHRRDHHESDDEPREQVRSPKRTGRQRHRPNPFLRRSFQHA
jgi:hypothetical protein